MKKRLLLVLGFLPFAAIAQQNADKFPQVAPEKNQAQPASAPQLTEPSPIMNPGNPASHRSYKNTVNGQAWIYGSSQIDFIEAGQTYYDLQSNASTGRRVILHSDGTVSITWTTAPDAVSGFPQRGSGYNYNNGTSFVVSGLNSTRVDNFRAGWPSIGVFPDGKEWIIAHDATNGGYRVSKNSAKGEQDWTTGNPILQAPDGQRPIWNRSVNSGNTIHLIGNYSDSSSPGDPRVLTVNGVRGPMFYSRSTDGGDTWDKELELLPGYDSTRFLNGGGDNYSIDARGNTVAVVVGGLTKEVTLFKSLDAGDTWTRTIVDPLPDGYAPFDNSVLALDTPATNDGTVDVLIDNNGNAHVFWGFSRVFNDDTLDDGTWSFFPASALLMHWDEGNAAIQAIAGVVDENQNGTLDIEPGTWSTDQNDAIPTGLNNVARTGNTSLVTRPCAGIDANGNIFVVYSAPRENDLSIDQVNCRDIYITYSQDGGQTWGDPQNLTQYQQNEDDFPSIARTVDGFVHMIWQRDEIPGTNLQNNTSSQNHPIVENKIMYAAYPVSEITSDAIGNGPGVGIFDSYKDAPKIFEVSQNYPNPTANMTEVTIYMNQPADLQLTVTNLLGQTVIQKNLGQYNPGNHKLSIDASQLEAGIYQYTLSTGAYTVTNQMIVR